MDDYERSLLRVPFHEARRPLRSKLRPVEGTEDAS